MRKLLVVSFLFSLLWASLALADWSTPVRISEPGACSNPQILTIGDTLHVVYDNFRGGDKISYVRSTNGGESWSQPKVISDTSENIESFLPRIMSYQGRLLVLCYSGGLNGVYDNNIAYIISRNMGISWTTPEYILNQNWERPIPFTAASIDSLVIIAAVVNFIDSTQFYVIKSYNFGDNWTNPIPIFNTKYGSYIDGVADSTAFHLTWVGRSNLDSIIEINYTQSRDYGQNWLDNVIISERDIYHSQLPSIAVNQLGNPVVTWMDYKYAPPGATGDIFLRTSSDLGITWNPINELVYNHKAVQSDVALEGDTIYVVWEDEITGMFHASIQYIRSTDNGSSWSEPFRLDQTSDDSRYPTLALSNGRVYAVWSDTRYSPDTSGLFFTRWQAEPDEVHQDDSYNLPNNICLSAYPNPFNSATTIMLSGIDNVEIEIYDITGRKITSLSATHGRAVWDASGVSSGVYFARVAREKTGTVKLVLVK